MKKTIYFLLALITAIGLTACSQQKEVKEPDKGKGEEEPAKEEPVKEEPANEEPTTNPDGPVSSEKVYQNEVFKDVVITESGDKLVVTGKAQVFEGVFQYGVYDGDRALLEDRYQTDGAPAWGDFKITFGKNIIGSDKVRLELFVYSPKDGSKINVLEVPVLR